MFLITFLLVTRHRSARETPDILDDSIDAANIQPHHSVQTPYNPDLTWWIKLNQAPDCPIFEPRPGPGCKEFNDTLTPCAEGCHKWSFQDTVSVLVQPREYQISLFKDQHCKMLIENSQAVLGPTHNDNEYCLKLWDTGSQSEGSFRAKCPSDLPPHSSSRMAARSNHYDAVSTLVSSSQEACDDYKAGVASDVAVELDASTSNINMISNTDLDILTSPSSINSLMEASSDPENVIKTSRSKLRDWHDDWKLYFWDGSCCPGLLRDDDIEFVQRDEETDPWRHGCQPFINWTSVSVRSGACTVRLFRDDSCKTLLDGEHSVFPPNTTLQQWSHWGWPCLGLTVNETEKNWTCNFDPRQPIGRWNFSGSWDIVCPEDMPMPSMDASIVQRELMQDVTRNKDFFEDGLPSSADLMATVEASSQSPAIVVTSTGADTSLHPERDASPICEPVIEDENGTDVSLTNQEMNHRIPKWDILMFTVSCCNLYYMPDPVILNETTSPWRRGCHRFTRKTSAYIDPGECTLQLFQDDHCKVLLDENTPSYTEDTCVNLSTDPKDGNATERCRSSRGHDFWHFNGSYSVTCPREKRFITPASDPEVQYKLNRRP